MTTAEAIGWMAAAIFPLSYLFKKPLTLVSIQLAASLVWIAHGVAAQSKPVIVANVVTSVAASLSLWRFARASSPESPDAAKP
jgi:hypothetical protein